MLSTEQMARPTPLHIPQYRLLGTDFDLFSPGISTSEIQIREDRAASLCAGFGTDSPDVRSYMSRFIVASVTQDAHEERNRSARLWILSAVGKVLLTSDE